jgi:hypothetical protein
MDQYKRRAALLSRLVRLREVERQGAVTSAAEAQGAHARLASLHARSGEIAAGHAARADALDGVDLAGQLAFLAGINTIMRDTRAAEDEAARMAEAALLRLREADRRCDRVSDRLKEERRAADRYAITREAAASVNLARKLKGR